MFAVAVSSKKKYHDLKLHRRHFLFPACLCLFLFAPPHLLLSCSFSPPLSIHIHTHTQTQTNTAVTVAYYSGQVRACRWGLLNAGAIVHQRLGNRGTCCDYRWRLAIYTNTHVHRPTHINRLQSKHVEWKHTMDANRHTLLCQGCRHKATLAWHLHKVGHTWKALACGCTSTAHTNKLFITHLLFVCMNYTICAGYDWMSPEHMRLWVWGV